MLKSGAILIWVFSLILLVPLSALGGGTTHPEFLVPVNPNDRAYEQAIEKLLGGRQGRGTMIYTGSPDAEGDFVISTWGRDRSDRDVDHPLNNFLTATGLAHEIDHALTNRVLSGIRGMIPAGKYDNMEEARVIKGSERAIVRDLGEGMRRDHAGDVYHVRDPDDK